MPHSTALHALATIFKSNAAKRENVHQNWILNIGFLTPGTQI